jgi:hypothetical protein
VKIEDIDNDQKTTLLGIAMVFSMWLFDKGFISQSDIKITETVLFLALTFYINRRNSYNRKDDNKNP